MGSGCGNGKGLMVRLSNHESELTSHRKPGLDRHRFARIRSRP